MIDRIANSELGNNNYLEMVSPGFSSPGFLLDDRSDPDGCCLQLYKDMLEIFLDGKGLPDGSHFCEPEIVERTYIDDNGHNSQYYEIKIRNYADERGYRYTFGLGTDFIGPSTYRALEAGVADMRIKQSLEQTRTIGGHMLWPRWIWSQQHRRYNTDENGEGSSLNMERGRLLFDRIDHTLHCIKRFYENKPSILSTTLNANEGWFSLFLDFKGFVAYWGLRPFVLDTSKGLLVRDLSKETPQPLLELDDLTCIESIHIPEEADEYVVFMNQHEQAIEERNKMLLA